MNKEEIDHGRKVLTDILDEKKLTNYEKIVMVFYEIQKKYQYEKDRSKPLQLMEKNLDDYIDKKMQKKGQRNEAY